MKTATLRTIQDEIIHDVSTTARRQDRFVSVDRFNSGWNAHYDFSSKTALKEINVVEGYDLSDDENVYAKGYIILSPWGSNQVLDVQSEKGRDICIKMITVNPGYMLSLQRHRGRSEVWEVVNGTLTVILDGTLYEVKAGKSLEIPQGAVHCMINSSDLPVSIRETQKGACREADNIRLMDFNGRPTYPLTSATEFESAKLYARIQAEHASRYGFDFHPHESWKSSQN